jgi:hypothetical protein
VWLLGGQVDQAGWRERSMQQCPLITSFSQVRSIFLCPHAPKLKIAANRQASAVDAGSPPMRWALRGRSGVRARVVV